MDTTLDKNIETSWFELSLPAQMVNIGNEIKRAFRFADVEKQNRFLNKAIQYVELTAKDKKNQKVVNEINIGIEVLNSIKNDKNSQFDKDRVLKYYNNYVYLL